MINREGTKKILKIVGITVAVLIVVGYGLFASNSFISGPEIVVTEPATGSVIATSTVIVKGTALRIQEITLNGRPIFVDENGNFSETVLLAKGYNVSLLSATDKFNRTTEYKLELVYKDK